MHWTPHFSLGAATVAFYSPALVASISLLHLHGSPRMAWFFLTLMSAIRISSGVLLILYESGGHYHGDLSTSTSITLGVGIFPLVFAMVGWFYIFDKIDTKQDGRWLRICLLVVRATGALALAIIIAGSILLGPLEDKPSGRHAGERMVEAGALIVVAILGWCIGWLIALWAELIKRKVRSRLLYLILAMLSLSAVMLILRVVYMCLVIFNGGLDSIWNPLNGSLDVLVRMSLLPEYVVVVVMVVTGFWMLRWRKVETYAPDDVEIPHGKPNRCHANNGFMSQ